MGNTLWSRLNNKSKSKKTAYEISKETNIPEDKVNEILKGERQLPNDRVDSFTEAIQKDNKVEKTLNMINIKNWYNTADLKAARIRLGYTTQISLARALNLDPSTINRLENRTEKSISDDLMMRYYDFLNDDLNKVIEKPNKQMKKRKKLTEEELERIKNADYKEVLDWWHSFDLRAYLEKHNLSHKQLANAIGYNSGSTICDLVNMTRSEYSLRKVITRLYLYLSPDLNRGSNNESLEKDDITNASEENSQNSTIQTGYYQVLDQDSDNCGVKLSVSDGSYTIKSDIYSTTEDEDPYEEYMPKHGIITTKIEKDYSREMELEKEVERYKKIIDILLESRD